MREDPACTRVVPAIAAITTMNVQECVFVVIFGSPLFCAGERCMDLRIVVIVIVVVALKDDFFLKTVPDIEHP